MKSIPLFFFGMLLHFAADSQSNYTINFDTSGKMRSSLPERVNKDDKLQFRVNEPGENFDLYTKRLKAKITKAQKHINDILADPSDLDLLEDVYNITSADISMVLGQLGNVLGNPLLNPPPAYVPVFKADADQYYSLQPFHTAASMPITFGPNVLSSSLPSKLNDGEKEMGFTLTKTDPFKKLLYDWLTVTSGDFNARPDFSRLPSMQNSLRLKIIELDGFLKSVEKTIAINHGNFTRADIPWLNSTVEVAGKLGNELIGILDNIKPLIRLSDKDWILKWLWYQDNKIPLLNPFPFRTEGSFGREPDTAEIAGLRLKISLRENFYKVAKLENMQPRQVDSLIDVTDSLTRRLDSLQTAYKRYTGKVSNNDKNTRAFANIHQQLNNGIFYVSNPDLSTYWMRHHDASYGYQLINDIETGEYLEDDRVILIVHNLQQNQRAELHLSFQDIASDESKLSEYIGNVLNGLAPVRNALSKIGSASTDSVRIADITVLTPATEMSKKIIDLTRSLERAKRYNRAIDYLLAQSDPITDIEEITDKSAAYHSQVANPMRKIEGPKKATYYMGTVTTATSNTGGATTTTTTSAISDTFHYRVNKLYRIFPMAGLAYSTTKFNSVTRDSGSSRDKNITEPANHFVIGAKVFLRKIDIRDSKIFTAKDKSGRSLWPSRTSVNVAFDIRDPLNNLYTGLGLDIWPGFCVNAGVVLNRYTFNLYDNNGLVQSKKLYRPGIYVGISTDVSLFTDLGKLLNLTK